MEKRLLACLEVGDLPHYRLLLNKQTAFFRNLPVKPIEVGFRTGIWWDDFFQKKHTFIYIIYIDIYIYIYIFLVLIEVGYLFSSMISVSLMFLWLFAWIIHECNYSADPKLTNHW